MKNLIKYILQLLLGYRRYLYVFALRKIKSIKFDAKEKDFFQFLSLLKNEPGVVLDVGANLGIMTVHLCRELPNATIHAIEPMPDNIAILQKVLKKKKVLNAVVHEVAVGEEEGHVTMILPDNKGVKMQGLSHVKHTSIDEWNEGEEFNVPITTIDKIVGIQSVQGIKMDVENYEFFALQGGKEVIERDHPIIYLELWDNENRNRCFDFLISMGYLPYVVIDEVLLPYDSKAHNSQNFIFKVN